MASASGLPSARLPDPASREPARRACYLQPGQLLACLEPTTVTTILGSCVSVCLHDRRHGRGAVNHFVLPHGADDGEASARFGPIAVPRLVDRMLSLGCARADVVAKLFGGAWILSAPREGNHIGAQNVTVARQQLAAAGIPIVAEDVLGPRGRKLVFDTASGIALVRKL